MESKVTLKRSQRKMLGDAGEHYALSQLSFAGKYAAKMPDNWEAYDLAVETGKGLKRVSVKTRSQSTSWTNSSWFTFNDSKPCDWLVFIFKPREGQIRAWVVPFKVALKHANKPGPSRKNRELRDLTFKKLNTSPLSRYEGNWSLERDPGQKFKD